MANQTRTPPISHSELRPEILRVLKMEADAIRACGERMERAAKPALPDAVLEIHRVLENGGKIIVTGMGKSGKIAQKIAATLSSTGSLAVYLHPSEGLHGDLGIVTAQDIVLALSYTGNTEELLQLVPSLKSRNIPIIGMGGNPNSRLAGACRFWIDAKVEQEACPQNLAPTTSTTLALALGDAMAVALMRLRGFDADSFAQNHPGGSLGKRLNLKTRDLMKTGDDVGTVTASTAMDEIVLTLTRKKLGAVLVTEGNRLLGLITEGDLRRALQHKERFFTLRAADIMTRTPVTVRPDTPASEALVLMQERESQISVLPVVSSKGEWEGLLRLHDLVRSF